MMKSLMKYFGYVSISDISDVYQKYAKEQELLKKDSRFTADAEKRINVAFEIWERICKIK